MLTSNLLLLLQRILSLSGGIKSQAAPVSTVQERNDSLYLANINVINL